jgi:hypothetical protein
MDSNNPIFYTLSIKRSRSEALIEALVEYEHFDLAKGVFKPTEPFEMRLSEGRVFYDVVGFQDTSNFAISERLLQLLQAHQFSGWQTYELNISGVEGRFLGFQIKGKCGKLIEPREAGFHTGYQFDLGSWDGSDFFCPENTVLLFCTSKVIDVLKRNKVTNIAWENINDSVYYSFGEE